MKLSTKSSSSLALLLSACTVGPEYKVAFCGGCAPRDATALDSLAQPVNDGGVSVNESH
jgi:hypothetical protein